MCCSHHSAGCAEPSARTLGLSIGHARRNRNAICRAVDRQHGARKACVDAAAATDKLRGAVWPDEGGDRDAQLALADEPPARPAAARPGRGRNVHSVRAGPGLEGHMFWRALGDCEGRAAERIARGERSPLTSLNSFRCVCARTCTCACSARRVPHLFTSYVYTHTTNDQRLS